MAAPAYSAASLLDPGPKNSGIAAVLSFFWTGLGQIYNGQILFGLCLMALEVVFGILCFVLIGFPLLFILWVWGIYDAYKTAEAINRGVKTA
jgi:TM2 domain-containing membrane protein YozV